MKKQLLAFLFVLTLILGFSLQAHATLELRGEGTSADGTYRLIYDTDLNITWYDNTKYDTWQNQMTWAGALTVNFGGATFDDWRLPSTVDGLYVYGYDGTTTGGFNITSSEMGHLFYTELGNKGWYDTSGNENVTGCSDRAPYCLTNTGDFQNLRSSVYWSGTEYAASTGFVWSFSTNYGDQHNYDLKLNYGYYAMAVRPGDVSVVPEPMSSILFVTGGATLLGRRYLRRTA